MESEVRLYPFILGREKVVPEHQVPVTSPYSGDEVGRTGNATALEVERALEVAAAARTPMARLCGRQRQQALLELAGLLLASQDEFALLIASEAGKPIRDARAEVKRGLLTLYTAAEEAVRIGGEVLPLDLVASADGRFGITRRSPIGIIAGITPFNFPLNLVLHKLAPALASGNPIIIKASPRTPLTALRLGELAMGIDLPDGAVSVLSGGAEPVQQLLRDDRVAMLSFTGSAAVGWRLKAAAGRRRVTLELGGNAANIVHHDANLEDAARRLVRGAFGYAGQSCISVQRVFIHRSVFEPMRGLLVQGARALRLGDPLEESTDVGPMIDEQAAIRTEQWVNEAVEGGARVLTGGTRDGGFYEPTVLENVRPEMRVCREEVFAPVMVLLPYDSPQEAIRETNASRFGLQAGLFTRDLNFALEAFQSLEAGAVILNDVSAWRADPMPYGGVKESGIGREGIRSAIESMTDLRMLVVGSAPE